jgi:hypothetical protein
LLPAIALFVDLAAYGANYINEAEAV